MTQPETWLLGPLEGYSNILMPVAHSLTQARRELVALQTKTSQGDFLAKPGGIGSIGFHVAHISGSLNRLFSYAKGNDLTQIQIDYLHSENDIGIKKYWIYFKIGHKLNFAQVHEFTAFPLGIKIHHSVCVTFFNQLWGT